MGRQHLSRTKSGLVRLVDPAAEDVAAIEDDPTRFRLLFAGRWIDALVVHPGAFGRGAILHLLAEGLAVAVDQGRDREADTFLIGGLDDDLGRRPGTEDEDVQVALEEARRSTLLHDREGGFSLVGEQRDRLGDHGLSLLGRAALIGTAWPREQEQSGAGE